MVTSASPATDSVAPAAGEAAAPYEQGLDRLSPNRNLAPVTTAIDALGRLEVGGIAMGELAQTYGTPLYVLDEETLRATCRAYRQALAAH